MEPIALAFQIINTSMLGLLVYLALLNRKEMKK